jgi:hypothetical protein
MRLAVFTQKQKGCDMVFKIALNPEKLTIEEFYKKDSKSVKIFDGDRDVGDKEPMWWVVQEDFHTCLKIIHDARLENDL